MTFSDVAHNHNLVRNDFFKDFDTYILPNFKHNNNAALIWKSILRRNSYSSANKIIVGQNENGEPIVSYSGEKWFKTMESLDKHLTKVLRELPQVTKKYKSLLIEQKLADIEKDF